ncbi:RES family NAD+ phosphorylase [Nocardioides sp. L-11A]|uniref:RES family NAD+ phosphorylase n=1 Tax=Nocardioides sp. L-11A TaxID=3043848 RepID=UPI00249C8E01|nr:RES family NAD+ phosphorylase [Nocardioides sp. L-11A]
MTPAPPDVFDPAVARVEAGERLYRVHSNTRGALEFNPGVGSPTRFAFFEDEAGGTVPVLYAAAAQDGAVAETLLHDVPIGGGLLGYDDYASKVMSRIVVSRRLRLAMLHGLGLRRLRVTADQVTSSPASRYAGTVAWARAAHEAGLDGLVWMSRQCNDARAYVFFGDRCGDAFAVDDGFGRTFATGVDLLWLIELCAPLRVDVLPPPSS